MSKKRAKASKEEQGAPSTVSVYDFLYSDARRIGSFLAQFDSSGHLQKIVRTEGVRGAGTTGATGEGGINSLIASAKGGYQAHATEEESNQLQREYDPLWANALTLLDYIDGAGLLNRDIHSAGVGEFVLSKGALQVVDLRVIKAMWNSQILSDHFGLGNKAGQTPEQVAQGALGVELVKIFPHGVQARVLCPAEGDRALSASWMALDPAWMTVPPEDILMKYGLWLSGTWNVVGIKDAMVDQGPQIDQGLLSQVSGTAGDPWMKAAADRLTTPLSLLAEMLAPMARLMMGRPGIFYGMTPLMIFREVSKPVASQQKP